MSVTDKHAQVKLMKNINKPLPDGGVVLPTSETGQSWDLRKEKEREKKNHWISTPLLPNDTFKSSLTHIQYNI